jgi:hypothetical protein
MVARKLGTSAHWARSFQQAKTLVTAMVADGEIRRFAPRDGRGFNQIALTQLGCDRYLGAGYHALVITWPQPASWNERREANAAARQRRRDYVAERVADGASFATIGRETGVSQQSVSKMWQRICADMGE